MARAGCCSGIFNASKLWKSSSTSGPSATSKAQFAKHHIDAVHGQCYRMQATRFARRLPGNELHPLVSRLQALLKIAASASVDLRASSSHSCTWFLAWLIACPAAGLCIGRQTVPAISTERSALLFYRDKQHCTASRATTSFSLTDRA